MKQTNYSHDPKLLIGANMGNHIKRYRTEREDAYRGALILVGCIAVLAIALLIGQAQRQNRAELAEKGFTVHQALAGEK